MHRLHRLVLVVLLATLPWASACVPGPGRYRGPGYGPEGEPFLAPAVAAAIDRKEDPVHRLILIGDAGEPLADDPTLAALGRWGDTRPGRTTVLWLGDNVYPAGLNEGDRRRGERVLRQQLEATAARKIFVPGNHDWGFSTRGAVQTGTLRNQQRFIEANANRNAEFLPKHGCPGPAAETLVPPGKGLERGLTVLVVDFHWWLLPPALRPVCEGIADTEGFLEKLRGELAARTGETVVVAAHHPLRSGGTHGGFTRGLLADLGAGVYYRLYGPIQDLWEPGYAQMIRVVSEVLAEAPPFAVVAGHDHSLQVLEGGEAARLMIVSGAGSVRRLTGVSALDETIFAHSHAGFVVIDFFDGPASGGAALVRVVETGRDQPVFTLGLDLVPPAAPEEAQEDRAPAPREARPPL